MKTQNIAIMSICEHKKGTPDEHIWIGEFSNREDV